MRLFPFRWLRTIRHFPPDRLWHRLRLKVGRKFYQPPTKLFLPEPSGLSGACLPPGFEQWVVLNEPKAAQRQLEDVRRLLDEQGVGLLNEPFHLPADIEALRQELEMRTPLWRENFGYLEFLLPLIRQLRHSEASTLFEKRLIDELVNRFQQFWCLGFAERTWSTYGVSRRVLVYCELVSVLPRFSQNFQTAFWRVFQQEADFVVRFLEWDVQGNHLIRNLKSVLAAALVFEKTPGAETLGQAWYRKISGLLPQVFEKQTLPDGFHMERTPMYHVWVLMDLLDCLHWLKTEKPDDDRQALEAIARRMLQVAGVLQHSSGQLALFGDSSLPQTLDLNLLNAYAEQVLGKDIQTIVDESAAFRYLPDAGYAVFRQKVPGASLILDCVRCRRTVIAISAVLSCTLKTSR